MRLRSLAVVAVIPLAAASLAACGSSKPADPLAAAKEYAKTAPLTIDQNARDAFTSLTTVHVTANTVDSGSPLNFAMTMSKSSGCTGSMTKSGMKVDIATVASGKAYMKAGASFWTAQANATAAQLFADKWVTGFPSSEFSEFCDLTVFAEGVTKDPISGDKPKVIGTAMVNGVPAVNLQVNDTDGTSVLSIAAAAPHNLLKAVSDKGKTIIVFSQFNQALDVPTPTGAIDISTLK